MASCGNGSGKGSQEDSTSVGDSSENAEARESTLALLPDTSYASADVVKYSIEVLDSVYGGELGPLTDLYAEAPGVFTFRKGLFRQADFGGKITGTPKELVVDWTFTTVSDNRETGYGTWGGGSGWTGQPLYVQWPDSCVQRFRNAGVVNSDFGKDEIIVGSLASKVYFINFATGKASREAINVENPIKGTVSLDPTLNGNLYVGHGVPAQKPWGARVIDLYKHEITTRFNEDPKALRRWHAYDSSPLHVGRFVFRPGENGSLYKCAVYPGELKVQSVMRYTVNGAAPGIESSMAVYHNYGYLCDNHGNVICVNLETLRPVWRVTTGDDTDATPVVIVEDGKPFVYVGSEIDRQNVGYATFIKVDGLTGNVVWNAKIPGKRIDRDGKHFDGGFYASALPGTGDCSGLLFTNCVTNTNSQDGMFVAINRNDGSVAYSTKLKYYAWSSPVGFVNESGKMYVVSGDCAGRLYLIEGISGKIIDTKLVGHNFESSPVVVGNSLIVGSRGNSIYKVSVH